MAIADNWGYVPLERTELVDMIRRLRPIADPDAVWFVEDKGVPVAYALGFPDLNVIIRRIGGHLLPFGFLHVLLGAKKVKDYRLFGLAVMPAWHGRGLDVLLYLHLYRALNAPHPAPGGELHHRGQPPDTERPREAGPGAGQDLPRVREGHQPAPLDVIHYSPIVARSRSTRRIQARSNGWPMASSWRFVSSTLVMTARASAFLPVRARKSAWCQENSKLWNFRS